MSVLSAILLGVFIGLLVEWVIDWLYWRKQLLDVKALRAENADLKAKLEELTPEPDDLKLIKGIGPEIERRLKEAGITSFQQLGKLTPSKLEVILGDSIKRLANELDILEQARVFAKRK